MVLQHLATTYLSVSGVLSHYPVVNLPQRDEDYEDYEDYEDFGSNLLGQTSFAEGIILAIGVVLLRDIYIYIHVLTSTRGN